MSVLLLVAAILAIAIVTTFATMVQRAARALPPVSRLRARLSDLGDVILNVPDELRGKTVEQLVEIRDYLDTGLRSLHQDENGVLRSMSADESASFDAGLSLRNVAEQLIKRHNQIANLPSSAPGSVTAGDGATRGAPNAIVRDDPYNLDNVRFTAFDGPERRHGVMRDYALRAIDADKGLEDSHKAHVEKLVRAIPEVAERVLVTGSEGYRQAWLKVMSAAARGRQPLLSAEDMVYLERAASLSNAAGGYAVPFTLDPTVILTQAQTTNPFRRIAGLKTINTDQWNGVTSAGITVSWDGEAGEVSDDTPTLAQPTINTWKAQGFVPFSIEIGQDWSAFESEMRAEFQVARDNAEAVAFATGAGDGSQQPKGIVTALTGTGQIVTSATTDTFAVADVYSLYEKPADPWNERGVFVANRNIYDKVRQFGTANNYHGFWTDLGGGQPPELLGQPTYRSSAMDGTLTALAENYVMVYGDFKNYLIVDRVGMNIELVPHLFGASRRPTGQRGLFCWWRVGADSVNNAAFGMLNVT